MRNLYDISQDHFRLIEILELEEGELTPELEYELQKILSEGEDKIKAYYHVYKNMDAYMPGLDAEIKRLQAQKKTLEGKLTRMANVMEQFMKATNMEKISDGPVSLAILRKGEEFIYDEAKVPKDFFEPQPDKFKLAEYKKWAKEHAGDALLLGVEFKEKRTIQIK